MSSDRRGSAPGAGLRALRKDLAVRRAEGAVDRVAGWAFPALLLGYAAVLAVFGDSWAMLIGLIGLLVAVVVLMSMWLAANEGAAIAVSGAVVAAVVMTAVIAPLRAFAGDAVPVDQASYMLIVVAAAAPYLPRYPGSNRAITSLWCQVGVVMSVAVSRVLPGLSLLLAVAWIVAVVWLRSGGIRFGRALRARLRSGVVATYGKGESAKSPGHADSFTDANLARGEAAETATGHLLDKGLDRQAGWTVLHSRIIPGRNADLDHLAIGLPGVFLIDSKDWKGIIEWKTFDDDGTQVELCTLNGSVEELVDRFSPTAFEASKVAEQLHLSPATVRPIICFTERMQLPDPVINVLIDGWDVTLVHQHRLVDVVMSYPDLVWRTPRLKDRRRGGTVEDMTTQASRRFVADLATVADYTFPPSA